MEEQVMELSNKEQGNRNYLKEKKPYVYEKIQKFDEKIRRGESIGIIQMQYNYQCNFVCQHCAIKRLQGVHSDRVMTVNDVKNLADQADALGLARFVITGGEPLTFRDFDQIVEAIGPERFYINVDTNGWYLNEEKAQHLLDIGVDRVQLSIDNFDEEGHDDFRRKKGSYKKTMEAVDACQKVGLNLFIQTVVTKQRLYTDEFIDFIKYFNDRGIGVFVSFAKPVGSWEHQYDILIDKEDLAYFKTLEKKFNVFNHLTPGYGLDMGCIAIKGMFSITQYGDVLPCPYMHIAIGNIFKEPLKDILENAMKIRYFGEKVNVCTIAQDMDFIKKYLEPKIYDMPIPVPADKVFSFSEDELTKVPFYENM